MWMSPGRRPSQGTRPATVSSAPTITTTIPSTINVRPRSFTVASSLKRERPLGRGRCGGRPLAEVRVRRGHRAPAARLAGDEADLQQVGLDDLRQRLRVVVDGRRDGLEPDRATAVHLEDCLADPAGD